MFKAINNHGWFWSFGRRQPWASPIHLLLYFTNRKAWSLWREQNHKHIASDWRIPNLQLKASISFQSFALATCFCRSPSSELSTTLKPHHCESTSSVSHFTSTVLASIIGRQCLPRMFTRLQQSIIATLEGHLWYSTMTVWQVITEGLGFGRKQSKALKMLHWLWRWCW